MRIGTLTSAAALLVALAGSANAADIVIGSAGPLTNSEALFGVTWMNGMELAIRQTNEAGGIGGHKLAFQREDDGGDPKQGTLVAQKQCDDAAMLAVFANFNSGVTIPSSRLSSLRHAAGDELLEPKGYQGRLRQSVPAYCERPLLGVRRLPTMR